MLEKLRPSMLGNKMNWRSQKLERWLILRLRSSTTWYKPLALIPSVPYNLWSRDASMYRISVSVYIDRSVPLSVMLCACASLSRAYVRTCLCVCQFVQTVSVRYVGQYICLYMCMHACTIFVSVLCAHDYHRQ